MPNFNRVILAGHMTRDPSLKYLPGNTAVCEFGLAVNHKWRDKNGDSKQEVCFVDCTAWGKTAELVNKYCAKGRAILVEGRLKLQSWTAQDGTKRSKHSVHVDNVQFLSYGDGERGGDGEQAERPAERASGNRTDGYENMPHTPPHDGDPPPPDDIPF